MNEKNKNFGVKGYTSGLSFEGLAGNMWGAERIRPSGLGS